MLSIFTGNEPFYIDKWVKKAKGNITLPELNYAKYNKFTEEVIKFLKTYPVMDNCKTAFVALESIKELDCKEFWDFYEEIAASEEANLIITVKKCDARTKIYSTLKNQIKTLNKEADLSKIEAMMYSIANSFQASLTKEGLNEFLRRENYFEMEHITLYNLGNDMNFLCQTGEGITITKELVASVIDENVSEQTFKIISMIEKKMIHAIRNQVTIMKGNEIGVLSALLREYRLGYKSKYYNETSLGLSKYATVTLSKASKEELVEGIHLLTTAIDDIKFSGRNATSVACQVILHLMNNHAVSKM